MKSIYLDYAAATPMADQVVQAMQPYFTDLFYNPSAVYLASRQIKIQLHSARAEIAHWLGCRPEEIIFTAGGTEADNLAIDGIMQQFPNGKLATSAIEHDAVLKKAGQYSNQIIPVDKNGRVTNQALLQTITDETALVSVMYANNEIGTIQPIGDLAAIIEQERRKRLADGNKLPIYFHTDAAQAAQYLDLHVNRLKVDLMSLNASKIYGPKQVGCLYVRGGLKMQPQIIGGGQERGLRSGTENVAGAHGMAAALKLVQTDRQRESKRIEAIMLPAAKQLKDSIDNLEILGGKRRLPNNLSLLIPGIDGERAVMELDELGIQCATGSACSALNDESSHVVRALGKTDQEAAATIRLTAGRQTSKPDLDIAVKSIQSVIKKLR